ncbi:MAG TPA: amino acid permease [Candidatus Aminicenantes bacterium]|nr:amino acid permease [Candidatus Aminicenantes bacterium]HPL14912.1 amino acid permease [Candidatus Aminicenantes bacterium]HQF96948.1 amino acid permease [Candidatus Aminicenantes bacterium]HQH44659.1 amino acid permease [Candidatus Aminicenantes bacterium]HQJ42438.1 amino acid permease [Candidatus Aminicenantes bacterium]
MKTKFSLTTATALVVANMVGSGVFTSLGFQAAGISSGPALLLLWILGGAIALFGALTYSEAGVLFPRSGGEYHFLTEMFHPALGFLAGWISFLVGFAAPVAAAAMGLGRYLTSALAVPQKTGAGLSSSSLIAVGVVAVLTVLHSLDKSLGARFQNVITIFKILFIVLIIVLGLAMGEPAGLSFAPTSRALRDVLSPAFAVSMFFVTFSYSGWNAAAYVAGEIENPRRNLPRSLIAGTLIVSVLYILLNFVFLRTVPIAELSGKLEVGYVFAGRVFGAAGGRLMGAVIAFLLLSSVSAMIIAGPRISRVIGEDYRLFRFLGKTTAKDIPAAAVVVQGLLSVFYIVTSTFDQVIVFIGFTLNLFTFMTVLGVMLMRRKRPDLPRPYRTWGYPWTPAAFLVIHVYILAYGLIYRPRESLAGLGLTAAGLVVYAIDRKTRRVKPGSV